MIDAPDKEFFIQNFDQMTDPFSAKSQVQILLDEMDTRRASFLHERAIRKAELVQEEEPFEPYKIALFGLGGLILFTLASGYLTRK